MPPSPFPTRPKAVNAKSTWYLDRSASVRHAIILTLHNTKAELLVVDEEGAVIDEFSLPPSAPAP